MKFQAEHSNTASVQAYGDDWLSINGEKHHASLLLTAAGQLVPWPCQRFEDLNAERFAQTLSLDDEPPELVVFGSGSRMRFPKPEWLSPLIQARVGLETMDLGAACRTFNILAGEGRRVVLAVLIDDPQS